MEPRVPPEPLPVEPVGQDASLGDDAPTPFDHADPVGGAPGVAGFVRRTVTEADREALRRAGFTLYDERPPTSTLRRIVSTLRHLLGLLLGGLIDYGRSRDRYGLRFRTVQLVGLLARPFVTSAIAREPFAVQLRRRLELLGTTYIKLGQILALREDILPRSVTEELTNLLDRLPAVPYPRYLTLIEEGLGRPVDAMFAWVDPTPLGSASIAQIHRATTLDQRRVILKVIKPGIRATLQRDARLLRAFAWLLQIAFAPYRPRRMIREILHYLLREVDLRREVEHAEIFAANFVDRPDVVFPQIYHAYCSTTVMCMEYLDGVRPDSRAAAQLSKSERDTIIGLGAEAVIRMIYRDGFFHADLHPGNLLILPGPKAGFIDLGMVGRLDENTRRPLFYYYYCLVGDDPDNAARYLASIAQAGPGGDADGFRRAVVEVSVRWRRASNFRTFSLAQLILESVKLGAQYRMYFPVELVLMVKALVTFEAVGQQLEPGFDVAAVSRVHINRLFLDQFRPLQMLRESLRGAPELVDAIVSTPQLVTEGLRFLEQTTQRPQDSPFAGIRGTLLGGFCLVAGALLAQDGTWPAAIVFIAGGLLAALVAPRRR
ncbi:MAG: AarF/UbiB family protein, partial [Acidobacteriota bacterium]